VIEAGIPRVTINRQRVLVIIAVICVIVILLIIVAVQGSSSPSKLTVLGKRLDASAPPLRADIPEGYGDTGFQATALIFPTEAV
jgi:hypothetical protein